MTGRSLRGLTLGLLAVFAIGVVDLMTGPDFGFAFFYFLPIVPVAWLVGRWEGMVVAIASAAMWFLADASLKPEQQIAPVAWNATSRLAIFLGGVYLIDRVRQDRAKMASVDAQRDEFLRILEHELPVPARDMVGALNAAQAKGSLDVADIEALRHRAEALAFLANDFVALGQAQAQRLELRTVPVDIAQLVTEVSRQRPDHGSVLVTVPGDGLVVVADPDRIRQVLVSTVSEVIADAGALDYVSINVKARASDAVVTISAAMPTTARRAVNAKDLRVSLHLSRLLVQAMGGSFTVERAALGKGARVTLTLPTRATATTSGAFETAEARRAR
jgi:signal transduction histidine kinase